MTRPRPLRGGRLTVLLTALVLVMALPATAALGSPPQTRPSAAPSSATKTAPVPSAKTASASHPSSVRKPKKPVPVLPTRPGRSVSPPPVDFSSSQPQTMRDDIHGDFAGLGFEQRMRVEDGRLKRWLPPDQGGTETSVPTDLNPAPPIVPYNFKTVAGVILPSNLSDRAQYGSEKYSNCSGCFGALFNAYHVDTVYLAAMDGFVYVLGTKGTQGYHPGVDQRVPANKYRVVLYKISMQQAVRGCANESCAVATHDFPDGFNLNGGIDNARFIGPSSLAAGHIGGNGFLAVGMTDGGVYIMNTSLQVTSIYGGMAIFDGSQTVPSTLAWDPAGSGLLAVGVMEWAYAGFFPVFNANGQFTTDKVWSFQPGEDMIPVPLSSAIFPGPTGKPVVAFGLSDGNLRLIDPTVTGQGVLAQSNDSPTPSAMIGITPVPRFDTAVAGGPDLAVSYQNGFDTLTGGGTLFRWDGLTSVTHVPISPNGGIFTATRGQFQSWFPGTKQGRLTITNTSDDAVDVSIQSNQGSGKGCWWAPSWADASAFPGTLTVQPGTTSALHTIGMLTGGAQGNCAATDPTGVKRAYLVVTPSNRPADRQIADLQLDSTLQLSVDDQTGSGSTTIGAPTKTAQLGAVGAWNISVGTSEVPTPTAAPVATVTQLTPGASTQDNPNATSAVYKITVKPITWNVPDLDKGTRLQAVVPPLTVQGSDAQGNKTTIGSFMPIGAVKVNPSAATVTTSGGTFFWENATTANGQTTDFASLVITAGDLAAPSPQQTVVTLTPGTPSRTWQATTVSFAQSGTGPFAANGVDALPLAVSVATVGTVRSDPTQSVYYRFDTGDLITNLYLAGQESSFFGIQPSSPAYPNLGNSRRVGAQASTDYAVSATPTTVSVSAVLWLGTPASYNTATAIPITATPLAIGLAPSSQGTSVTASNFSVGACSGGSSCSASTIAPVGPDSQGNPRAALYQAGPMTEESLSGPPLLGVLVNTLAVNSLDSLPLTWTAASAPPVASSPVVLTSSTNSLSVQSTNNFPSGSAVEVPVVSHGLFATVSVPVS